MTGVGVLYLQFWAFFLRRSRRKPFIPLVNMKLMLVLYISAFISFKQEC